MSIRFLVEDHYKRVRGDASFWRPYIEEGLRGHGLSVEPILAIEDDGTNANFWLGANKIFKIYTPFFHGRESRGMESAVLRSLATESELPVPKVLARGDLVSLDSDWKWPYVVLEKLPGQTLDSVWPQLPHEQRMGFAFQIGDLLKRLHKVVPSAEVSRTYQEIWPKGFIDFLNRQHQVVSGKADLAVIPIYDEILRMRPAALVTGWPVLLHGDLDGSHLLVQNGQITGLFDFGDAKVGDPLYDFVTIQFDLFDLDARLFTEFLRGYGMKPATEKNFAARLTAYAILHEWGMVDQLPKWAVRSGAHSLAELGQWLWRSY
jgi:hygromycin-B 7''-O-kinase